MRLQSLYLLCGYDVKIYLTQTRPEVQELAPSFSGAHFTPTLASTPDVAQGEFVKVASSSQISEDVPVQSALTLPYDNTENQFVSPKDMLEYPKADPGKETGGWQPAIIEKAIIEKKPNEAT